VPILINKYNMPRCYGGQRFKLLSKVDHLHCSYINHSVLEIAVTILSHYVAHIFSSGCSNLVISMAVVQVCNCCLRT
jgi:hypothetical protein